MINRDLLNKLHDNGLIDKRHVLWWQLGFEGRRILSEEEFNSGLTKVVHEYITPNDGIGVETLNVWTKDNVPILLRNIKFSEELEVPCFISVNPMSHDVGWRHLEYKLPVSLYRRPHIRGVVIEATDEFLFWYPLIFNHDPVYYSTFKFTFKDSTIPPALVCPIVPSKFYENLIKRGWSHGKRSQTRPININCKDPSKIVPYYEFDPKREEFTIYPAPIFSNELDFPIVIAGDLSGIPRILGTGYISVSRYIPGDQGVSYWKLDKIKERTVRNTLIRRLGNINR